MSDDSFVILEHSSLNSQNGYSKNEENGNNVSPSEQFPNSEDEHSFKGLVTSFIPTQRVDFYQSPTFSEYKSIDEMNASDLLSLVTSNIDMKDMLQKTNSSMADFMEKTKKTIDDYKTEIQAYQMEILDLQHDNEKLTEDMEICHRLEDDRIVEHQKLRDLVNTKTDEMQQMETKMAFMQYTQIPELVNQIAMLNDTSKKVIPIEDHEKEIGQLKTRISSFGEKIVVLTKQLAFEKSSHEKTKSELEQLKKDKMTTTGYAQAQYEKKIKNAQDEISMLRIQVDTYKKDFEAERCSRESMAGERDSLLNTLSKLQITNQKLIMESESNLKQFKKAELNKELNIPYDGNQIYERQQHSCPLCRAEFKTLMTLQNHVQECLDESN